MSSKAMCYDRTRRLRFGIRRRGLRRFPEDDPRARLASLGRGEQPAAVAMEDAARYHQAQADAASPLVEDAARAVLLRVECGERVAVPDLQLVSAGRGAAAH